MLRKLFEKKEMKLKEVLLAPLTGKVLNIVNVPDPVFSQKLMGDGIAIEPTEGVVVSPIEGEVVQVFPTKHAIGIKGMTGTEVLIHIGLETVAMEGEGFETHIQEGDKVKAGEKLVTFDLELVKEKAKSTITPIVITNGDIIKNIEKYHQNTAVEKGKMKVIEIDVNS
ncbi:PTS glucose transporter subunit IIA [Anaerobacillus sp. MEB173]|uniref:PTS sugar transporter subunit IIA n=1 Tax=Anaerobacillus sp. MEB173 TaxID=3383345 RepID=UPI003F8DA145